MVDEASIVVPPPAIRDAALKTAARARIMPGPQFDAFVQMIREKSGGSTKFQFLSPENEYEPFYLAELAKVRGGAPMEAEHPTPAASAPPAAEEAAPQEAVAAAPAVRNTATALAELLGTGDAEAAAPAGGGQPLYAPIASAAIPPAQLRVARILAAAVAVNAELENAARHWPACRPMLVEGVQPQTRNY